VTALLAWIRRPTYQFIYHNLSVLQYITSGLTRSSRPNMCWKDVTPLRGSPWRPRMTLLPRKGTINFVGQPKLTSYRLGRSVPGRGEFGRVVFVTANAIGLSADTLWRRCQSVLNNAVKTCNSLEQCATLGLGVSSLRWSHWRHGNTADWWLIHPQFVGGAYPGSLLVSITTVVVPVLCPSVHSSTGNKIISLTHAVCAVKGRCSAPDCRAKRLIWNAHYTHML